MMCEYLPETYISKKLGTYVFYSKKRFNRKSFFTPLSVGRTFGIIISKAYRSFHFFFHQAVAINKDLHGCFKKKYHPI
jgi:hypothetical protein